MQNINGYILKDDLVNDNAGTAKWGFAKKNGRDFFIKEFLSPVYPLDGTVLSKELILKKRQICDQFQSEKLAFYNVLNKCSTGNVVVIADFFRWESRYYIVTEKVDAAKMEPDQISRLNFKQKVTIAKVIAHCMKSLHQHGIIHGDLKPTNILFKETKSGMYTAKIIDFDSSFLESNPPTDEDLQGDMVYFAPESFLFIAEEEGELTRKIDIFALGIIFHQYFCGELPKFDSSKYDYIFEAVLDGDGVELNKFIPDSVRLIISKMLNVKPAFRPSIEEVFDMFNAIDTSDRPIGEVTDDRINSGGTVVSRGPWQIAGDLD